MDHRVLILQEKPENIRHISESLNDCEITTVNTMEKALSALRKDKYDLIISAVHLEHDGSVFDFLKCAKGDPETSHIPFLFYCCESSSFAKSVRDGLQIAARALGAEKYISMEIYDQALLRRQCMEFLGP